MSGRASTKVLVGVAVIAVAAFAGAYFLFFTPDSPERLTLSTPTGGAGETGTTLAPSAVSGMWKVAPGSEAGYRVREKLAALPAQSDAVGRTPAVTGQVRIDTSGGAVTASDARFEADLLQLTSDRSQRDGRIKTQGLESERFPKATFVATEPIRVAQQPVVGQPTKVNAVGDLTLHGVTKRVTIPIDAQLLDNRIELVGSLKFPMSDFAIEPPNIAGFVTVEPEATLEFKLLLEKG